MSDTELAWAAGLFDGEGSASVPSESRPVRLHVGQKDRRVLDRFRRALGMGAVYGPHERNNGSAMYCWHLAGYETVPAAFDLLRPYLSEVKTEQIENAIRTVEERRDPRRANAKPNCCSNGHEWTEKNTLIRRDGSRNCRACARERARAIRARKRREEKVGK